MTLDANTSRLLENSNKYRRASTMLECTMLSTKSKLNRTADPLTTTRNKSIVSGLLTEIYVSHFTSFMS
jgi:hypothetical protein